MTRGDSAHCVIGEKINIECTAYHDQLMDVGALPHSAVFTPRGYHVPAGYK